MTTRNSLQDRYLKETAVSKITSIPLQSLRNSRLRRTGIPYYKINRSVFYRYSAVISFMEQHRNRVIAIMERLQQEGWLQDKNVPHSALLKIKQKGVK